MNYFFDSTGCARDAQGLVLFGPFGRKNRSEAKPEAARSGAQMKKKILN